MNKGKYKVGKVSDFAKRKGWFFGQFASDDLLKSDAVEVAWQKISNKKATPHDKHYHTSSVEINIVISGEVRVSINGKKHILYKGEFYIIWQETVVSDIETSDDAELIVIRTPSVDDKVIVDK